MELISLSECARRLGVTQPAVRKAIDAGRVTMMGRNERNGWPLVGWPLARDQWKANTNEATRPVPTPAGLAGPPPAVAPDARRAARAGREAKPRRGADADGLAGDGAAHDEAAHPSGAADAVGAAPSYAQARAIREQYQARLARLEYEEKIGKLVPADQVKAEAFKAARQVRDAMLNISGRIAHQLAAETDPAVISARIDDEIRAALRELVGAHG